MRLKKALISGLLAVAFAAYLVFDLGRFFSLEALRQSQQAFAHAYAREPVQVLLAFGLVYVAVTALSLPGASLMTLAAGASFGLLWGSVVTALAATAGATLAMLSARHLLRDSVERRFGKALAGLNRGLEQDGAFYLFSLRLLPLVPFFVLNLLMGLTRMKTWTYGWVSLLGMLAGTLAYVNAGTQLAKVDSLRSVLSPGLIGSFVLLGLMPLGLRWLLRGWQNRRIYARWQHLRPKRYERNLVVIGAGAGGLVSAYIAAAVKAKVTLVEAQAMGGDCLNTGCVPSKALIQSARLAQRMRHASHFGLPDSPPAINFQAVMQRVQQVIRSIAPHDSVQRYAELGVEVLQGHARITSPWSVEVSRPDGSSQSLTTRAIVIAAGSRPRVPELPGLEAVGFVTSDTLWDAFAQLNQPPKRLVVLGGGVIGCELAQCFARLGSQVVQVEQAPRLLLAEDEEVSALALAALQQDGVRVLLDHQALRCEAAPLTPARTVVFGPGVLVLEHQGVQTRIGFDALLCAVGRVARLSGYGLEELGIPARPQGGTLPTDAWLATVYPNIYAAGDVAGPYQFTHAAAHQAWYATVNALFGDIRKFRVDHSALPRTTFIEPEIARVGLNELEARAQGVAYEITRFELADLDRAIIDGETRGFVKLLTVPGKDRILGATIVGSQAGELLAEYTLAMKHGLGLNKILGTVHSYPTLSEANKYAAGNWKRAHAPTRLLRWVARYHAWRRG
jgi:pyruvate/2-oxoglutarate dehydrogenase complex dihydrolipoamide dehydrogenase (E3) component/uncharacterized membrane protein YdjX (TVP38/TMEM64 family)